MLGWRASIRTLRSAELDVKLKTPLEKQAAAYRKLAAERAVYGVLCQPEAMMQAA